MENVSYVGKTVSGGVRKRQIGKSVRQLSAKGLKVYTSARKRSLKRLMEVKKQFMQDAVDTLRHELKEATAEANEFITSPHLLFRPLSLGFFGLFPLFLPLLFVPWKMLAVYMAFFLFWYALCVAFVATEVAMRPPWYRTGLPTRGNPPYWREAIHDPKIDLNLDYENVEFCRIHGTSACCTSKQPQKHPILRGWFIPCKDSNNVVVCAHGAGRDRRNFLRHSKVLHAEGYSVLLFDFSEHGLSDGSSRGFSFGVREAQDVSAAVSFVRKEKSAQRVILLGTSTGATSSILAVADHCADSVDSIIAENPFSRPADLFCHHLDGFLRNYLSQNQHHIWRRLVFWIFSRVLLLRVGLGYNYGAVDAVSRIRCPIFVMHSPADDVVPYHHGESIFDAAQGPKVFWSVPDAEHCALYDRHPDLWCTKTLEFMKNSQALCAQAVQQ
mmetsp:Transcript_5176/g.9027  ORF Transcript_5176/g.9027 Transcript_5176/m.9027 type:complete len:441 (+) Transcript_5176:143-1465(+)